MIEFKNSGRLIQSLSELPNLKNAKRLYCDVETRSFDPKEMAVKPHHGHRTAGICITADTHKGAWYVPIRCAWQKWNLPLNGVMSWLNDTINTCEEWVNHGIKFDAHFLRYDDIDFNCKLVDTLALAKLIDSDRMQYGLASLSNDWLERDILQYENRLKGYLQGCKSKDYGDVPADIIGEYGCQDVLTNRELYEYLLRRRSDRCLNVWDTEVALTPALFDMEVVGMRVDPLTLQKKELQILTEMVLLEENLHRTTGIVARPHTNPDCYEIICNRYGLPVLGYTDKGDPSFDKDALTAYLSHPLVRASEEITKAISMIRRYRKLNTLLTFFVRPYQEHAVDSLMHPDYNQTVRTGRMSCRRPNAQQLSPEAKELVYPNQGCDFVRYDYSQIEFRLIVHYIQDAAAINAYTNDPDTDFHTWVAKMCGIPRKPAKNINFAIGYGGGKRKVVSMLASNMELVGHLSEKVTALVDTNKIIESQRQQTFELLCTRRGEMVYNDYHERLPTLKSTTYRAARHLELRGFVFNAYGRERRLPRKVSFRAFNTIIQSCAADVMKERFVALAPRYNKMTRDLGVTPCGCVHDEVLLNVPKAVSNDVAALVSMRDVLEATAVQFRVPIRTACGCSSKDWRTASSDDGEVTLPR